MAKNKDIIELKETLSAVLENMEKADRHIAKMQQDITHLKIDVGAWKKVKNCLINAVLHTEHGDIESPPVNSPKKRLK
jgi:hypothetical protein